MRTILASLTFVVLYGIAVRVYLLLRARRESSRWHPVALGSSTLLGGLAFYLAQQIRMPHVPQWLDLLAFAIMCLGASAIPVLLELAEVIPARLARRTSSRLQAPPRTEPPPSVPTNTTAGP